jgi:hypothetical protein
VGTSIYEKSKLMKIENATACVTFVVFALYVKNSKLDRVNWQVFAGFLCWCSDLEIERAVP